MTTKTLERILILRTMLAQDPRGDGISGIEIADRASTECDHALLEGLPEVSRRGIGQKLNAMSLAGLVDSVYDHEQRLHFWFVTRAGRELAASIDGLQNDGVTLTMVECAALASWNRATLKAVFPNAEVRKGFLASEVGQAMAKIAAGARGATS